MLGAADGSSKVSRKPIHVYRRFSLKHISSTGVQTDWVDTCCGTSLYDDCVVAAWQLSVCVCV